jgi:hypothetical protein
VGVMTRLVWDQSDARPYESGIDRGVLYVQDGENAVVWNGLTSVEENFKDTSTPLYRDGVKYCNLIPLEDYSAVLSAWTYPDELDDTSFGNRFGMSYRTFVSDDTSDTEKYYKIHIIYNITFTPSPNQYQSDDSAINPTDFKWDLATVPEQIQGFRPTAHVIIDSRYFDSHVLGEIENVLYGDVSNPPHLPKLYELAEFAATQSVIAIVDNGDGTWTAFDTIYDKITMLDETTFQIVDANATYLDADTYEISNTTM